MGGGGGVYAPILTISCDIQRQVKLQQLQNYIWFIYNLQQKTIHIHSTIRQTMHLWRNMGSYVKTVSNISTIHIPAWLHKRCKNISQIHLLHSLLAWKWTYDIFPFLQWYIPLQRRFLLSQKTLVYTGKYIEFISIIPVRNMSWLRTRPWCIIWSGLSCSNSNFRLSDLRHRHDVHCESIKEI